MNRCPTCHRLGNWPRSWCSDCWPLDRSYLSPRGRPKSARFYCLAEQHTGPNPVGENMRDDGWAPRDVCAECHAQQSPTWLRLGLRRGRVEAAARGELRYVSRDVIRHHFRKLHSDRRGISLAAV